MNRRILRFYYITSVVFLLFILVFTAYRLKLTIDENREASGKRLEALRISALSIYLAEGEFNTEYFKSTMRDHFASTDRLMLLAVYSEREGIHYLISENGDYLAGAPGEDPGAWRGAPEYTLRPVYENLITLRFSPGMQQDLFIDGIFRDLESEQLYPIIRELFYILLVYLFVAAVFMLFAAALKQPQSDDRGAPRDRSGDSVAQDLSRFREAGPLEASALFSPTTGLGWRQHLPQRLGSELERAAGSDQDLSILLINSGTANLKNLAASVLDVFPIRDLIFEYDSSSVAVILPDKDLDRALREAREFQHKAYPRTTALSLGLSARNGRLISSDRVLAEADRALKQAVSGNGGGIVAFRADPDKYRASIAARSRVSSAAGGGTSHSGKQPR